MVEYELRKALAYTPSIDTTVQQGSALSSLHSMSTYKALFEIYSSDDFCCANVEVHLGTEKSIRKFCSLVPKQK